MTYTLALEQSFNTAMSRLDKRDRLDVLDAFEKVQKGLPSVHIHKLDSSDFVSFSVNRNARRVICARRGNVLHALWVDAHDAAYQWAERHRTVQVGHHVRTIELTERAPSTVQPQGDQTAIRGPLAHLRDKDFARFEVPPSVAESIRPLSEDALVELAVLLRPPLGEALMDLALDPDRLGPVWLEFDNRRKQLDAGTYREPTPEEAARNVVNAGEMWLPTLGQQAVRDALAGGIEAWRIFLHPSQQRLVTRNYKGAAKVTGGPGTGKTIVALHRARHLLREVFPDERVLLTTFNRTLAGQLQQLWNTLTVGEPDVAERLDIRTLTGVAQALLDHGSAPSTLLVDEETLGACWEPALELDTDGHGRRFLESEREHVLGRAGAWTVRQYLRTRRARSRKRLDKASRQRVFASLQAFDDAMAKRGGGDGLALAREATKLVSTGKLEGPWAAIVCDELQDASASELRLLAALTRGEDGATKPNALFLCGDGYQRLYASPIPLSHCGIDVRGRSSILRLNYRTTEGIRAYAVGIAEGLDPDALDEDEEPGASLRGYRSLRGGTKPELQRFQTEEAEAAWLAEQVKPVLVLSRTRRYRDALAERLRALGQDPMVLDGDGEPSPDGITLCTLHRSKGLEASRVVVAGRQKIPVRWPGGDAADKSLWTRKEQCLLYVGITRARDWCAVSCVGL